jgi:hypothetical protein
MPRDKQSIMNSPMAKAYTKAGGKVDEEGVPYGDRSGKDDTATYPEGNNSGGGSSFIQNWRNKIFGDSSWLPEKEGEVVIVPSILIGTPGNTPGFKLPPGYGISPEKTPPFTPPGEPKVPTIGIIILPEKKAPRKPYVNPDRIDKMPPPPKKLPGSL